MTDRLYIEDIIDNTVFGDGFIFLFKNARLHRAVIVTRPIKKARLIIDTSTTTTKVS